MVDDGMTSFQNPRCKCERRATFWRGLRAPSAPCAAGERSMTTDHALSQAMQAATGKWTVYELNCERFLFSRRQYRSR
jgi:hypothetical protein